MHTYVTAGLRSLTSGPCGLADNPLVSAFLAPVNSRCYRAARLIDLLGGQRDFREWVNRVKLLLAGRSSEGISDGELAVERLAVVEVFGVEDRASGLQRGGDYQGVVDVVAVLFCNFECCFVDFQGDGERGGA